MNLCCHLHKPGRCCDAEDCSPCCARCPDPCPLDVGKRGAPKVDLSDLDGFARFLANKAHFVGADLASTFEDADSGSYIYRVRDPERMTFTVERYDRKRDKTVPVATFEVSVRRTS